MRLCHHICIGAEDAAGSPTTRCAYRLCYTQSIQLHFSTTHESLGATPARFIMCRDVQINHCSCDLPANTTQHNKPAAQKFPACVYDIVFQVCNSISAQYAYLGILHPRILGPEFHLQQ